MQSMEFHSRYLYINEALLNCDSVLGDISFKDERCCRSSPGCSNSSGFIDVFIWSKVDIDRRYWPNFCTAALCWGTAGATGYGQVSPGCRGCAIPGWVQIHHAQQAKQRKGWQNWGPVVTMWSHSDKTGPGMQWAVSCGPGAGTLISGVHGLLQAWL